MAFWNKKSEPSGINTNPELNDRTRYEAIPFVLAVPQLSQIFYRALASKHYTAKPFFEWNVKPGDRVKARAIIGQFNLKSYGVLGGSDAGEIMMPKDGIITEISNNPDSKYLFAFQQLLPFTEAQSYRNMPASLGEQSLSFCSIPLPYGRLVDKINLALCYDGKRLNELDTEDNVNKIIRSELDKMGYVQVIPVMNR